MNSIFEAVQAERDRQKAIIPAGFDEGNTKNDWVSYITAYAGRASDKVFKNEKQGEDFRTNMVKVAALAVAALEAQDKGYI